MDLFKDVREQVYELFNRDVHYARFDQYLHLGICHMPCLDCGQYYYRLFEVGQPRPPVGEENHPRCDCYYAPVQQLLAGTISRMGSLSPDIYLKQYGVLPDYYITKETAINEYGWRQGKNTMAGKAPGKMIGGNIYENSDRILPERSGRIWYECDVDYESGGRNSKRLFYSNDGLMFYSTDHGQTQFYQIL